ncbi:MAG: helix-turn-helix domain-containing protein [Treponemataceae bacterium]|nr:helix-turn-helix domain-containing protein [Treponemataceae bacterium]
MAKELGEKIRCLMDELALSQKQLAELANVTEVSMSRYISGERDPSIETLANIATALHTTTDFLLGKESDKEFEFRNVKTLLARSAKQLTNKQKREIIAALLGD